MIAAYDPEDLMARPLRPHQEKILIQLREQSHAGARITFSAPTGSGKTLTMNEFIFSKYLIKNQRVLWLAPSWILLEQALRCIVTRYGDVLSPARLGYIARARNSDNSAVTSYCQGLGKKGSPLLVYTTLQSLHALSESKTERRAEWSSLRKLAPACVVIDEQHWGVDGEFDRTLRSLLKSPGWGGSVVLSASATPAARAGFNRAVGFSDVEGLIRNGVLAKPVTVAVNLKTPSRVRLDSRNAITPDSYRQISLCEKRNAEIAAHVYDNAGRYGKTVIFCCNKAHANALGKKLRGLNPVVIHGDVSRPQQALTGFAQDSSTKIALLVRMGIMGFDCPQIETVVLARPTTSKTELVQMIGRGQRTTGSKKSFYVVDFFENLADENVAAKLAHFCSPAVRAGAGPQTAAKSSAPEATGSVRPPRMPHIFRHSYANQTVTQILSYDSAHPAFASLDGLQINPSTTFGLEFELTSDVMNAWDEEEWKELAGELIRTLTAALGRVRVNQSPVRTGIRNISYTKWNIIWDSSCGWEIVTPILRGADGFEEVVYALQALRDSHALQHGYKITVNTGTGCHLHVGADYRQPLKFRNLVQFVRRFEGALFTLCAPSRYTSGSSGRADDCEPNEFCKPLTGTVIDDDVLRFRTARGIREAFCNHEMRYHTVNLSLFDTSPQRLEVRMHSGTLDAGKISLWVALWQNILTSLDNLPLDVTGFRSDAIHPEISGREDGDIVHVARRFLGLCYAQHRPMLKRLHERRRQVMGNRGWKKLLGTRRQNALLESWQGRYEETTTD